MQNAGRAQCARSPAFRRREIGRLETRPPRSEIHKKWFLKPSKKAPPCTIRRFFFGRREGEPPFARSPPSSPLRRCLALFPRAAPQARVTWRDRVFASTSPFSFEREARRRASSSSSSTTRHPLIRLLSGFASPPRRRLQHRLTPPVRVLGDARRLLLALPRGVRGLRPGAERRLGVFVRARDLRGILRRHAAAVRLGPPSRLERVVLAVRRVGDTRPASLALPRGLGGVESVVRGARRDGCAAAGARRRGPVAQGRGRKGV